MRADQVLHVQGSVYPYLVLQQGRLDHLKDRPGAWQLAYNQKMVELFDQIAPHLPATCTGVLDIGGGIGGIDVLITRHYRTNRVSILDGAKDPPQMVRHAQTFNDLGTSRRFLMANGVRVFQPRPATDPGPPEPYDLIVSFGSWCFHYPPAVYLDFVKACCRPDTVLILEVREGKPDWLQQLLAVFEPAAATVFPKFTRWVFKPRAAD